MASIWHFAGMVTCLIGITVAQSSVMQGSSAHQRDWQRSKRMQAAGQAKKEELLNRIVKPPPISTSVNQRGKRMQAAGEAKEEELQSRIVRPPPIPREAKAAAGEVKLELLNLNRIVRRVSIKVDPEGHLAPYGESSNSSSHELVDKHVLSKRGSTGFRLAEYGTLLHATQGDAGVLHRSSPVESLVANINSSSGSLSATATLHVLKAAAADIFSHFAIFALLFSTAIIVLFIMVFFRVLDLEMLFGSRSTNQNANGISSGSRRGSSMSGCISLSMNDWRSKQKEDLRAASIQAASREFAERSMNRWRENKQEVDAQTKLLMNALASQTVQEYFQCNDLQSLEDLFTSLRIEANVDLLRREIKKGDCVLLNLPDPDPSDVVGSDQLVRCVRFIRVVVKGKTTNGLRTLIECGKESDWIEDQHPIAKVPMNAGDAENAWPLVLHSKLGLPDPWLRQFVTLACCPKTVVEVHTSSTFPQLPTWYVVDEVTVQVKEDADKSELLLFGLPNGDAVQGGGKSWLWADFNDNGKKRVSSKEEVSI